MTQKTPIAINHSQLIKSTFSQCPALNRTAIATMAGVKENHLKDFLNNRGQLQPAEVDSIVRQLVNLKNQIRQCFLSYDPAKLRSLISDTRLKYTVVAGHGFRGRIESYRNKLTTAPPESLWSDLKNHYMALLPKILN